MADEKTAIAVLISNRVKALSITRKQLVVRAGFSNFSKGLRRLEEVCDGDFSRAQTLLSNLANALSVDASEVDAAIVSTRNSKEREDEERYRAAFRPHAIIQCERNRPDPIWLAAILGVENLLKVSFEEGSSPVTYADQTVSAIEHRLMQWKGKTIPCYARPTGFLIVYSLKCSVQFDLCGNPLRKLDKAIQIGVASLCVAGRTFSRHHK